MHFIEINWFQNTWEFPFVLPAFVVRFLASVVKWFDRDQTLHLTVPFAISARPTPLCDWWGGSKSLVTTEYWLASLVISVVYQPGSWHGSWPGCGSSTLLLTYLHRKFHWRLFLHNTCGRRRSVFNRTHDKSQANWTWSSSQCRLRKLPTLDANIFTSAIVYSGKYCGDNINPTFKWRLGR